MAHLTQFVANMGSVDKKVGEAVAAFVVSYLSQCTVQRVGFQLKEGKTFHVIELAEGDLPLQMLCLSPLVSQGPVFHYRRVNFSKDAALSKAIEKPKEQNNYESSKHAVCSTMVDLNLSCFGFLTQRGSRSYSLQDWQQVVSIEKEESLGQLDNIFISKIYQAGRVTHDR